LGVVGAVGIVGIICIIGIAVVVGGEGLVAVSRWGGETENEKDSGICKGGNCPS
jgi:hypothetical protein